MNKTKENKTESIHQTLAYSYTVYFIGLFIAIVIDFFWPVRIIPIGIAKTVGIFLLIIAPLLILWAQKTTGDLQKEKGEVTHESFKKGPYRFTRSPSHLGIVLLLIGLGFLVNSTTIILITLLMAIISHSVFLEKQDLMLSKKYGDHYHHYKKSVRRWL